MFKSYVVLASPSLRTRLSERLPDFQCELVASDPQALQVRLENREHRVISLWITPEEGARAWMPELLQRELKTRLLVGIGALPESIDELVHFSLALPLEDRPLARGLRLFRRWFELQRALFESERRRLTLGDLVLRELLPPLTALHELAQRERQKNSSLTQVAHSSGRLVREIRDLQGELATDQIDINLGETPQALRLCILAALKHTGCDPSVLHWESEELLLRIDALQTRRAFESLFMWLRYRIRADFQLTARVKGDTVEIELRGKARLSSPILFHAQELHFVRVVVEAHGGQFLLQPSTNDQLQLRLVWPSIQARLPIEEEGERASGNGALVWLVDDEPAVRLTVRRWLLNLAARVEVFSGGPELLEAFDRAPRRPELVLCDSDMPTLMGLEVLSELHRRAPDVKRVLYTAYEPTRKVIDAFNAQVVHRFIDKRDGEAALTSCLQELLQDGQTLRAQTEALDELFKKKAFTLFLQPIYEAKGRKIEACEALLRSKHPAFRGPLDILDATRVAGRELDLQRALTERSLKLRERLPESYKLFMNIDPIIFSQTDQLDTLFEPIYPFASSVVLELTERAQLCGDQWIESVSRLRSRGFQIALDDLGAGYNSLGAVAAVNPEIIKLDISLVSKVHESTNKKEMVRLLSEYAQRHHISTVAEGIEEAPEAEVCTQLGVRWLQGYHLARPGPAEALFVNEGGEAKGELQ